MSMDSELRIAKITHVLARQTRDYFNFDAIFSDESAQFVSNPEPKAEEIINISIRVFKDNVDSVFLVTDNGEKKEKIEAVKIRIDGVFDIYAAKTSLLKKTKYHFVIIRDNMSYYYNKKGIYPEVDMQFDFMIIPDFAVPKWAKSAVMYQIYVDRFFNGDKTNDVVKNEYQYLGKAAKPIDDWNQPLATEDICNFYGGDLQGVIDKMKYLKSLNIDAIYFNPIFVSPSNHKYDIQDYDYVDPHYGVIVKDGGKPLFFEKFHNRFATMYMQRTTDKENLEASNDLMIKLIEIAHENGIRIILDGVFNHCGAYNKWLDRENFYGSNGYPQGAYRNKDSIYKNYFRWYDEAWPNNECYDSWWGHDNHPKLNFESSPELYEYILEVGKKWVSPPFNADGWRLDVGADLGYSKDFNHKFWRDFRDVVKKANPDAIILAEHYGDPADWLDGTQWDSVMNYDAFMEPLTWFLTGMEKHSEEFRGDMLCNSLKFESAMRYYMSRFTYPSLQIAMNELSNHDHSRFLTRTNMSVGRLHTVGAEKSEIGINKGIMREAVMFQMFWPGAPTVYYGDEAGLCGWTDPDNRRTYPWGHEDESLLNFHRDLIGIHKENTALIEGSLEYLYLTTGFMSFGRFTANNKLVCAMNNNPAEIRVSIPVWKANIENNTEMKVLISSDKNSYKKFNSENEMKIPVVGGAIDLIVPPYGCILLKQL